VRLLEITLHNVGVFHGRQSIDLQTDPGRPVVLIGGMNGRGKTTVLDSLQIALFGRRAPVVRRSAQTYEAHLAALVNRDATPQDAGVTVSFLIVEDGVERVYRVNRVWSNKSNGSAAESLSVWLDGVPDPVATERWNDIIEVLLPVDIAELFFFDGEKIEQLADPVSAARVIEAAVHGLLGVGLIDRLSKDLTAIQRRWKAEDLDNAVQDELRSRQSAIEVKERELADLVQECASLQNRVDETERSLQNAQDAFEQGGGDLAQQRSALVADRDRAVAEQAEIRAALIELCAGPLPLALVLGTLDQVGTQIEMEEAASAAEALAGLLEDRDAEVLKLLTDRSVDRAVHTALAHWFESDRNSRAAHSGTARFLDASEDARATIAVARDRMRVDAPRAASLLADLASLEVLESDLDRRIDAAPPDAIVANMVADLRAKEAAAVVAAEALLVANERVAHLDHEINADRAALDRMLERYAGTVIAAEDRVRMLKHAARSQATLRQFGEALVKRHLEIIEASVLLSFRELLGKSELVASLSIDSKTYGVRLIASDGQPLGSDRLSAGERQLLATALLWGLARASGRRLPMFIDTPLGRLDSTHRRNLIERYFPMAADQLVLLSTDEEVDAELFAMLEPSVSKCYLLSYNEQRRMTTVQDGYFGGGG